LLVDATARHASDRRRRVLISDEGAMADYGDRMQLPARLCSRSIRECRPLRGSAERWRMARSCASEEQHIMFAQTAYVLIWIVTAAPATQAPHNMAHASLYTKAMMKSMQNNSTNIAVPPRKYSTFCQSLRENTDQRLKTWIGCIRAKQQTCGSPRLP
jgi:hypothetical protein